MNISRSIVTKVRNLNPPGRFLEKNLDDGLWYDIGDKKAAEKTAQALRDRAANFRKQMSEENSDKKSSLNVMDENDNTSKIRTPISASSKHERSNSWNFRAEHHHHNSIRMSPPNSHHNQILPSEGIRPKTSFDPSVKGWGSCIDGRSERFYSSTSNEMRKNGHRRSSSTPNVSYNEDYRRHEGAQRDYDPFYGKPPPPSPPLYAPPVDEFSFKDSFSEMFQESSLYHQKERKRKAHHRRANTLPAAPIAFGGRNDPFMEDVNEFEPIPFSNANNHHSYVEDDEKRLSKDILSPEFVKVIFGSKRKIPDLGYVPSNRAHSNLLDFEEKDLFEDRCDNIMDDDGGDHQRWNRSRHDSERHKSREYHQKPTFHSIHEEAHDYSKRRELREQHLHIEKSHTSSSTPHKHHRKRRSGDFSDLSFVADAFGGTFGSFDDVSKERNARCHRKTKSTPGALTQHYQDRHPPSKKYRQVSTLQSLRPQESHLQASFALHSQSSSNASPPLSPRPTSITQNELMHHSKKQDFMTRDQFSYIAQGVNFKNDSFASSPSPHQQPIMPPIHSHSYVPIKEPLQESILNNTCHGRFLRHLYSDETSPTTVFEESSPRNYYGDKFDDSTGLSLPSSPYSQRKTISPPDHPEDVFESRIFHNRFDVDR